MTSSTTQKEKQLSSVNTDKDLIVICRDIDQALFYDLHDAIKDRRKTVKNEECVLFLTTPGGDPDAGYRIAKLLQRTYKHIRLAVVSYCKSAGTLIAIAANEVAFGDRGELGPLDVQVSKQDEFGAQASGLDIIEAMEAISTHMRKSFAQSLVDIRFGTQISTRLAGDLAAQLTSSIAEPLYAQIDPQRVAEMQRAMSIALKYGERLLRQSHSLKKDALQTLVTDYPTHSFVIDYDEAQTLFQNVSRLTQEEESFCDKFWQNLLRNKKAGKQGGPFIESFSKWLKNDNAVTDNNVPKSDEQSQMPKDQKNENTESSTRRKQGTRVKPTNNQRQGDDPKTD